MDQPIDRMRTEKIENYRTVLGEVPYEVWNMSVEFDGHQLPVSELIARGLHWAASLSVDAGLGGHHHDGGADALFRQMQCWVEGLKGNIPSGKAFQNIAKQMVQEVDPAEYEEYKRLHEKYGS